ncbi:MAG: hypothetical protein H7831_17765 [Magnetococcus sp. WYHC-3]
MNGKPEEWVGLAAVAFVAVLVVSALLPPDLKERVATAAGWGSGNAVSFGAPGQVGIPPPVAPGVGVGQAIPVAVVTTPTLVPPDPTATLAEGAAPVQPGLVPFERAPLVPFSGTIQQITEMPQSDRQVHIWVSTPDQRELHVSVAPAWYLSFMGCTLAHDMQLTGRGFQFNRADQGGDVIYAKKLTINGRPCLLRNDEGFALWSNKLR